MRTRLLAVAGAAVALASAAALTPAASARPHSAHNRITIHAQPNPDVVGDPTVIFGRLIAPNAGNQTVTLWHRLAGRRFFTPVERVRTDPNGFYDIPRAEGVVNTNREWFVRADGARSRTVHERVIAEVTANAPAAATTNEPIVVKGRVTPNHAGERVFLQEQVGQTSDDWRTIASGFVRGGSNYSISHRFRVAGTHTLRTVFRGDRRNLRAESSSVDVVIEQAQNPDLTLGAAPDPIADGQSVTLSGKLAGAGAGQPVTLLAHQHNQNGFVPVGTELTSSDGTFSFGQSPDHNTVYRVQALNRKSALVYVAVRDVVTIAVSSTKVTTGQTVVFSGGVSPNKTGHSIELQLLGNDGDYHTIQSGTVGSGSSYQFDHVVQSPGQKTYRVRIDGGPINAGGSSVPVTITVTPPPPTA
ncbi:MAG TPA: hypothetical protein VKJ07_06885 [Mycobacteriales bacterium]|nr:hypothetical protein [Mycobacteriales bacterium]